MPQQKGRNYRLTIFNDQLLPNEHTQGLRYFVYQKEKCPDTGRIHYQTFLQYKNALRLTTVRRRFPSTDVRIADNPEGARNYCMKLDTRQEPPVEWGTFVTQGKRSDLSEFADLVRQGKRKRDLILTHPCVIARYRHFYQDLAENQRPERRPRQVILLLGDPGTGKTKYVWDNYPDHYAVPVDKNFWFDGYDGQDTVLIDDYSGQYPLTLFLRLLHEYPERVPRKGGYEWWNPKTIVITSNIGIDRWYKYEDRHEHYLALKRRIHTIINFPLDEDQIPTWEPATEEPIRTEGDVSAETTLTDENFRLFSQSTLLCEEELNEDE